MAKRVLPPAASLLVGVGLVVLLSPAASATYVGSNGVIAFDNGFRDLLVMNPDGTNSHSIFHDPTTAPLNASWSPNGRLIAFQFGSDIYTMHADGSRIRLRVSDGHMPSFGPDGQTLAFIRAENVYVMPFGGSATQVTTGGHVVFAEWSPTGEWIAYIDATQDEVSLITPGGTAGDCVTCLDPLGGVGDPTFAPSGKRIAYSYNDDVYVIRLDGSGFKQLTDSPNRSEIECSWSPDGRQIVCSASGSKGTGYLRIRLRDGVKRWKQAPTEIRRPAWQPV